MPNIAGRSRSALSGVSLGALVAAGAATTSVLPAASPVGDSVAVIVRAEPGSADRAVTRAGGVVRRELALISGVLAEVPRSAIPSLAADPDVLAVTPDAPLRLLSTESTATTETEESTATTTTPVPATIPEVADTVRAPLVWAAGAAGEGVDVALIDSGIAPVPGLDAPGKVVNGPDLSFDTGQDRTRHLDGYGHGTHMAGIIAGRDAEVAPGSGVVPAGAFAGIAPGSRLVNLKVADSQGVTGVSQVIAALDWVVQHRRSNNMNVRVLNLSFGTDGVQDYTLDPLAYAAEKAWHAGIVVVVAAGNEGYGTAKINNPAYDPYVIAVGGSDRKGTTDPVDDVLGPWSSRGDDFRRPDVVAPGQSLLSLRSPGSALDQQHPGARVGTRFFRGTGTSQSTAVVAGAAAVLLSQRPSLTPDQVKALLSSTAIRMPLADPAGQGAGSIDVRAASRAAAPTTVQSWPKAGGTGTLAAARGSSTISFKGTARTGDTDLFGSAWNARSSNSSAAWSGGDWTGNSWTGNSWSGGAWFGNSWSGGSFAGNSWSGNSWSGNSWSGNSWSSAEW